MPAQTKQRDSRTMPHLHNRVGIIGWAVPTCVLLLETVFAAALSTVGLRPRWIRHVEHVYVARVHVEHVYVARVHVEHVYVEHDC